nr:NADH dehydrogenase subunit 3 [Venus verrucosa]UJH93165.1 NADH dehydrogenase subunit 3 [Venus verrucosa]
MDIFVSSKYVLGSCISGLSCIFLVGILSSVLLLLGMMVGQKWRSEWSKLTAFECGFDALSSTRNPFSLRFFLLALLFLVFDMEIILLFPFIFSMMISWAKMMIFVKLMYFSFLMILILGLIHELNEGTLDWKFD